MGSIDSIVSDLAFGRASFYEALAHLSEREMTQETVHDDWTVKDIIAHIVGWDERVLQNLPLLVANRGDEIPSVDRDGYNQQSVARWRDQPLSAVLKAFDESRQQVVAAISALNHIEVDTRRERQGKFVTIRSYVINIMMEHDRDHAVEILEWRKIMEKNINPEEITQHLITSRAKFMQIVDSLDEATLMKKGAVERWSIKDIISHMAEWERIMLQTAEHLFDPSLPESHLLSQNIDELNLMTVAQRDLKTLSVELRFLRSQQGYWDEFIQNLKPKDWLLRGSYPWGGEGSIAEIVLEVAEHYDEHLPHLEPQQA